MMLNVTSGNAGIGHLNLNLFKLKLGDSYIGDFSILDKGSGEYQLEFMIPQISKEITTLKMRLDYGNLKSNELTLNIQPLYLMIYYNFSSGTISSSDKGRISYLTQTDYTVGFATDSNNFLMNNTGR